MSSSSQTTDTDTREQKDKRNRMKKNAINVLHDTYGDYIPKNNIKLLFNYVENYCKIVYNKHIPYRVYTSSEPCSVFYIRNKLDDFLEVYGTSYEDMSINQIMLNVIGENKYNDVLTQMSTSPDLEPLPSIENPKYPNRRWSSASGKKRRTTKRKTTKRRTTKRRTTKRGSVKRK
uniref:Uncharacterized protein n=1 Tax=viral metagenome TaxID=1070528 RepID=A0A6C0HVQ6_9ZZZZ